MPDRESSRRYWRRNQRLILGLLAVWFLVSVVFSIFLAEAIYDRQIGSLPASFWWAQQGAMFVFVIIIFVYAWWMDRIEAEREENDPSREDIVS